MHNRLFKPRQFDTHYLVHKQRERALPPRGCTNGRRGSQGPGKCRSTASGNKCPWKGPNSILMAWMLPHPGQKLEAIDRLFTLHFEARVELSLHTGTKPSISFKGACLCRPLAHPSNTHPASALRNSAATSSNFTESQGGQVTASLFLRPLK